jgi:hypothetical protein
MNSYSSIKELILDTYVSEGSVPNYEKRTRSRLFVSVAETGRFLVGSGR